MIGGKFSYVVTCKSALFLFFSGTGSIAEDDSVIDGAFILLRFFRLLRLFEHSLNAPVMDELATVGLSWATTALAPSYMPSRENQVHKKSEGLCMYVKNV